jgi:hypothetical protein
MFREQDDRLLHPAADHLRRLSMTNPVQHAIKRRSRHAFALAAALLCGAAPPARAEVHVEGNPAEVRITTSQDAISDVLAAVAKTFNIQYRSAIPLDAAANASYSGSFGQVISRLLDGYNYVIKREPEGTEIVVFGRRGEVAIVPPKPTVPPAKGIVSQWR